MYQFIIFGKCLFPATGFCIEFTKFPAKFPVVRNFFPAFIQEKQRLLILV